MPTDGTRTTNELKIESVCYESFQYNLTGKEPFIRILPNNSHMYANVGRYLDAFNSPNLASWSNVLSDEEK